MITSRRAVSWALRASLAQRQRLLTHRAMTFTKATNSSIATSQAQSFALADFWVTNWKHEGRQWAPTASSTSNPNAGTALRQESPYSKLLTSLNDHFRIAEEANTPYLEDLLRAYRSDPAHWSAHAYADPSKDYTRNLVCEVPGSFNLMLLVWTPGKASLVHDHAQAHCVMKVLRGRIRETRYEMPRRGEANRPLREISRTDFDDGKVSYMCDDLGLHSVGNPHPAEYAVSLHLYTPPNAAVKGCNVYDVNNGGSRHVLQGPYDSIRGVANVMRIPL